MFSAIRGRYFAYDLRLGVDGLVSGMSMYADVFVRMWVARVAENWDEVRDIHGKLLVILTSEQAIPGAGRYLLQRRGIFKTTVQRGLNFHFSPTRVAEIEHNLEELKPYMIRLPSRGA